MLSDNGDFCLYVCCDQTAEGRVKSLVLPLRQEEEEEEKEEEAEESGVDYLGWSQLHNVGTTQWTANMIRGVGHTKGEENPRLP